MRRLIAVISGASLLAAAGLVPRSGAEAAKVVPPPAVDEASSMATTEVAVLAGGCFWGVQGVFQHVAGVSAAVSGYAGGNAATAHYEEVGMRRSARARLAMPSPSASPSIRIASAMAASCKSTSPSRTTRRN